MIGREGSAIADGRALEIADGDRTAREEAMHLA